MRRDMVTFTAFIKYFGFICLLKPTEVALASIQPGSLSKATDYELTPASEVATHDATNKWLATRIVCGADHGGANLATSFRPTIQSIPWSFRDDVSSGLKAPHISDPDSAELLNGEKILEEATRLKGIQTIVAPILQVLEPHEQDVEIVINSLWLYIEHNPTASVVLLAIRGLSRISMEAKFTSNCRKLAKEKIYSLITANPSDELSREARSIHFATVELGLRLEFAKEDNVKYFKKPVKFQKSYRPILKLREDHGDCMYHDEMFVDVLSKIAKSKSDIDFLNILYAASGEVYKPSQATKTIEDVKIVETQIALKEVCRALAKANPDLHERYRSHLLLEIKDIFVDSGFKKSMAELIKSMELRSKRGFLDTLVAEVKENSKSPYTWNDIFVRQMEILFYYGIYIIRVDENYSQDEQFVTVWKTLKKLTEENLVSIEKDELTNAVFGHLRFVNTIERFDTMMERPWE